LLEFVTETLELALLNASNMLIGIIAVSGTPLYALHIRLGVVRVGYGQV